MQHLIFLMERNRERNREQNDEQNMDTNSQLGAAYDPSAYPAPAHPAPAPAYAPSVPCPKNLLISCQPSVQSAPCSGYAAPDPYAAAPALPPKPAYRNANEDEEENEREEPLVGQAQN